MTLQLQNLAYADAASCVDRSLLLERSMAANYNTWWPSKAAQRVAGVTICNICIACCLCLVINRASSAACVEAAQHSQATVQQLCPAQSACCTAMCAIDHLLPLKHSMAANLNTWWLANASKRTAGAIICSVYTACCPYPVSIRPYNVCMEPTQHSQQMIQQFAMHTQHIAQLN